MEGESSTAKIDAMESASGGEAGVRTVARPGPARPHSGGFFIDPHDQCLRQPGAAAPPPRGPLPPPTPHRRAVDGRERSGPLRARATSRAASPTPPTSSPPRMADTRPLSRRWERLASNGTLSRATPGASRPAAEPIRAGFSRGGWRASRPPSTPGASHRLRRGRPHREGVALAQVADEPLVRVDLYRVTVAEVGAQVDLGGKAGRTASTVRRRTWGEVCQRARGYRRARAGKLSGEDDAVALPLPADPRVPRPADDPHTHGSRIVGSRHAGQPRVKQRARGAESVPTPVDPKDASPMDSAIDQLPLALRAEIDELPTLPAVVSACLDELHDPRSNSQRVADLMLADVGLTARALKLVNSSIFAL
ncbi:MAG: hypothetical protein COW73_08340, partial [Nitrospirae bacterium CG18_big_fil_WC_8_21_14_2_50_70_55]